MLMLDFIRLSAPFIWQGSTRAGKLKLLRIMVMTWIEEDAAISEAGGVFGTELVNETYGMYTTYYTK